MCITLNPDWWSGILIEASNLAIYKAFLCTDTHPPRIPLNPNQDPPQLGLMHRKQSKHNFHFLENALRTIVKKK